MSVSVDQLGENVLPASFATAQDARSDLGDGSSSLSDIEDKEADQDDIEDGDSEEDIEDDLDNEDENDVDMESDANDSEAETERLDNSPHKLRKQKDVVLSSRAESQTYERSPSKLQHESTADGEGDEEEEEEEEEEIDDLSEEEGSIDESVKSFPPDDAELDSTTATTSLENSSGEGKTLGVPIDTASKKRKRSLLPERRSIEPDDPEEPARKRTGSAAGRGEEYAIDDAASTNGDIGTSNPISGDISDAESDVDDGNEEDEHINVEDDQTLDDDTAETAKLTEDLKTKAERKRASKLRKDGGLEPNFESVDDPAERPASQNPEAEVGDGEEIEDGIDHELDEAEAALKNEEEQERKRVALDQLGDIERHFSSFRDRLHEERLAQLDREEAMLKADNPTHPLFLAMLRCVDARRDEKLRIEAKLTQFRLETIQRTAVGKRSQILAQFHQEVRDLREKKIASLGEQWYDIQHDRRGYGSHVEDYTIKYPTRRADQVRFHNSHAKEVSLLSGIAKYVGFPAAPDLAPADQKQLDQDFEKMGRSQQKHQTHQNHRNAPQGLPLQDLAAMRAATSTSSFKPAEEQFIEQTPWANPQHPSHVHLIQRQSSAHQAARTSSPFTIPAAQARRHSHQQMGPAVGIFSNAPSAQQHANGSSLPNSGVSPMNPFTNPSLSQKMAPSPLGSRQPSLSPQQSRIPLAVNEAQPRHDALLESLLGGASAQILREDASRARAAPHDFPFESGVKVKREQNGATAGRF